MNYSISITNQSGASENIAIFQSYPNLDGGLPLIWAAKNINEGNNNTFSWEIDWALNWGTTPQPLVPGVLWTSGGTPISVEPDPSGANYMTVSYSNDDFESAGPFNNSAIPNGSMDVLTDSSFTVGEAANMSISVYMNGTPTFAMQGKPNGTYEFDTHPTYYLCTTDSKVGVAVSGEFLSKATPVVFAEGETSKSYILDGTLNFVLQQ
nr:hypothetical protein [uncultured Fluviicola sp.]